MERIEFRHLERLAQRRGELTLRQQCVAMRVFVPSWRRKRSPRGLVCWEGWLRPTDYSDRYKLRIELTHHTPPQAFVLSHSLMNAKGEVAPHVYRNESLCLYRPKYDEWERGMFVHETTIPWSSLWLYYYEIWLTTGKWMGGGEHPEPNED